MSRADRHALSTLAGLILLESALGALLQDAVWAHTAIFLVDALLGAFVLAFALSIEADGGPRR